MRVMHELYVTRRSGERYQWGMAKSKTRGHTQYAAVPFRFDADGLPSILLLTTRGTGRWSIPKGWPMAGRKPREAAAQEAYEEAGLVGHIVGKRPIGNYHYAKQLDTGEDILCRVDVFLLHVERQLDDWPEKGQRQTGWFAPDQAAALVQEGGLAELLLRSP
jgi:8-oxo-dGTP pyrophosphatase MutT (NUDIX family)